MCYSILYIGNCLDDLLGDLYVRYENQMLVYISGIASVNYIMIYIVLTVIDKLCADLYISDTNI